MTELMKEVGFDVKVFVPNNKTPLTNNHMHVFLRRGSVFMQVVPVGLDWAAHAFYGKVAKDF